MTTTVPREADNALPVIRERLAESLLAIYLHGSAVDRGLRPHSDVDLLAVVNSQMTPETRNLLAVEIMNLSGRYPSDPDGRRPIELIVFSHTDLSVLQYPARCEFIYGEWLRGAYEAGEIPGPVCDPEYTLILAQARRNAKPLFGPGAEALLPVISNTEIRQATCDLLPSLIESLPGDERNVLLTLARMWRTMATGEFVPKDVASEWAESQLPHQQAALLAEARKAYLGDMQEDWANRQDEIRQVVSSLHDRILSISAIGN